MNDQKNPQVSPDAGDQIPFSPGLSRRAVQRGTYHASLPSRWAPIRPGLPEESVQSEQPVQPEQPAQPENPIQSEEPVGVPSSPPEASAQPTPLYEPSPWAQGTHGRAQSATNFSAPATQRAERNRKGPGWFALFVSALLAAALGAGTALVLDRGAEPPSGTASSESSVEQDASDQDVVPPVAERTAAPDWQAVASAVRPATVSIMVEGANESATGSGVVYDSEGRIITNHHVVSPAVSSGNITVTTHDGRIYEATIVGTDQTTDLAVLQLVGEPSDMIAARFATSEELEVGQPVMAVGSPLGLADTVTTGVISALDRPVTVEASGGVDPANPQAGAQTELVVTNAIQIDASINPGNSGGPLFDATGGVIGINSSIASNSSSADTAGSIGLGFAIPVDLVKSVADQIINTGSVQHALLGVEIKSGVVVRGSSSQLGAEVATVMGGGAAAEAGLQPGDVIVGIDGHAVTSGPALTGFVRRYTAGNEVTLDVVRGGEDIQVTAVLKAR